MKVLIVLAMLLAVAVADIPFKNCGSDSDHVKITSLNVSPWPPAKGSAATIKACGDLDLKVESGTYHLTVTLDDIITPIDQSGDLCTFADDFKCPHEAGSVCITKSFDVPGDAPRGSYAVKVELKSQDGPQLCAQVDFELGFLATNAQLKTDTVNMNSPVNSADIIDFVNSQQTTWTAGVSPHFAKATLSQVSDLCGVLPGGPSLPEERFTDAISRHLSIPESFDSREEWSDCKSIKEVRDQGACGSCWAVAAAAAMTDRICVASQQKQNPWLSSQDLVSCCGFQCGMGCNGGWPSGAFDYWTDSGLVTGGPWDSHEGCYPYQIESCDHHVNGTHKPCGDLEPTPSCKRACENQLDWSSDKHTGATSYSVPGDEESIQKEILAGGPVEAAFTVYADFPTYKSGVYQHTTGGQLGGHAVKIIGWGVENSTPYWLVANSWNEDWGDKGFFKIRRGNDECGIESGIVAGKPKLNFY